MPKLPAFAKASAGSPATPCQGGSTPTRFACLALDSSRRATATARRAMSGRRIKIKIITRASRNEIVGTMADGTLKVKLTAAPVAGAANQQLLKFLSREWGMPKARLRIARGEKNNLKIIEVRDTA